MHASPRGLAVVTCFVTACVGFGGRSVEDQPPPLPLALTFHPTIASYVSVSHRTIDRGIEGQARAEGTILRYRVTAEIARADSAFDVTFVVDTVTQATASNIDAREIADASGATFVGRMAPTGQLEVRRLRGARSPLLDQLVNQLRDFFPHLPPGGIRPGLVWVDTTEAPREQGGAQLRVMAITRYGAREWEGQGPGATIRIDWEREYTVTGIGEQMSQPFSVRGTGSTSGVSSFSAEGTFLGSIRRDELHSKVLLESMGTTIQLRQTQSDTVRILTR